MFIYGPIDCFEQIEQCNMSLRAAIIPVTPLQQNCTIFWCDETNKGVVIDPGGDVPVILDAIEELGLDIECILLTHGHFDHVGGAMDLAESTNAPIVGPHKEDAFITSKVVVAGEMFNLDGGRDVEGNRWLDDGDEIKFGNVTLNVAPLPVPIDSAHIFPPCSSINPFAMGSPIPSPP